MQGMHVVEFIPSGRGKARCAPNPCYPDGIALDATNGAMVSCKVDIPYPSPECGIIIVRCKLCRYAAAVTVAGRPDDPVSIKLPCQKPLKSVEA
jgi:predicted RNA-binding Zn-ribbon protein involved in translation (DUF1610 family)